MIATPPVNGLPPATQKLLDRLEEPQTAEALNRLLDRLDVLAFAVEAVDGVVRRGEVIADSIGQSVAELKGLAGGADASFGELAGKLPQVARAGSQMADVVASDGFQRLMASGLLDKLSQPDTIANLKLLLEKMELVVFFVSMVDGFLARSEVIADSVAETIGELRGADVATGQWKSLLETGSSVANVAAKLAHNGDLDELPGLIESLAGLARSGMFDTGTIRVLAEVGQHAAASYQETKKGPAPPPLGPLGMLKAMSEPDVQRAMGFALAMARNYGKRIQ
jgi:uncharacterized protein YjgD (DUF1641 family)